MIPVVSEKYIRRMPLWLFACVSLSSALVSRAQTYAPSASSPAIPMAPAAAGLPALPAVIRNEPVAQTEARLRWFREARFGLFIHWGVYVVPAGMWQGRPVGAEWIMHQGKIPVADYRAFAKNFTASKYDPVAWAQLAADAGMKYVVITAKHHDGFALFDSAYSDWNAVKASGAQRDLIKPLAEENEVGLVTAVAADCNAYVLADRQRLKQILLNLLTNAVKYNHPGGSVTVRCRPSKMVLPLAAADAPSPANVRALAPRPAA